MKKSLSLTFAFILVISSLSFGQAKLKSATVSFETPVNGDDKDWNTSLNVSLFLSDGTLLGSATANNCTTIPTDGSVPNCFCCVPSVYDNQGKLVNPGTKFVNDGTSRGPFTINIANPVAKQALSTGYFTVTMYPNGNDRWVFIPTLILTFDDGTLKTYNNYQSKVIEQDATQTFIVFH